MRRSSCSAFFFAFIGLASSSPFCVASTSTTSGIGGGFAVSDAGGDADGGGPDLLGGRDGALADPLPAEAGGGGPFSLPLPAVKGAAAKVVDEEGPDEGTMLDPMRRRRYYLGGEEEGSSSGPVVDAAVGPTEDGGFIERQEEEEGLPVKETVAGKSFEEGTRAAHEQELRTQTHRRLQQRQLLAVSIQGETTTAPSVTGNPITLCYLYGGIDYWLFACINDCPSRFYKVVGTGASVTASTCAGANFDTRLYVWLGDKVSQFVSVDCNNDSCGLLPEVTWPTISGVAYYIQVTSFGNQITGNFTLTVTGVDKVSRVDEVSLAEVQSFTKPPTEAPTNRPTDVPTRTPTAVPTKRPTLLPTETPTKPPTKPPTRATVRSCAARGTTYWVRDRAVGTTRRIANNTVACLAHPYNLEVRPCNSTAPLLSDPLRLRLVRDKNGEAVHKSPVQGSSPFYLFGSAGRSPGPLPNGKYYLTARSTSSSLPPPPGWSRRFVFTQACGCGKGRKGAKGCPGKLR